MVNGKESTVTELNTLHCYVEQLFSACFEQITENNVHLQVARRAKKKKLRISLTGTEVLTITMMSLFLQ